MTRTNVQLLAAVLFALQAAVPALSQFGLQNMSVTNLRNPAPGYYFLSPNSLDSFSVLDNAGKNLYRTRVGPHLNVLTYRDKWMTYFAAGQGRSVYIVRNAEGRVVDTMNVTVPYTTDFHEGRVLSDTSYVVLGLELVKTDMSSVIDGGSPNATVIVNVIQERTFDGRTLFTWRSIDHIPVTDAADAALLKDTAVDYIHINSITVDKDNNFIVSCRHLDEVIKINRTTGAIMWRLGGSRSRNNQFAILNDSEGGFTGFSHQHAAMITAAGTLLLFDNGNLKPEPRGSRAVEYELNTTNMTATRVWQHVPAPNLYAPTMGSVEEMENGNILIGYGSGSNTIVAQEVNKDGTIEAQITNPGAVRVWPYRVHKSTYLMTGVYSKITSTGNKSFSRGDSSCHLSINFTRVDTTTSVVVERHSYAPHASTFSSISPCGMLPTRWVVRVKHPTKVAGSMSFDLGTTPGVEYPDQISLFHRSTEGTGVFNSVESTYSPATKKISVSAIRNGEYAIAYSLCLAPVLLQPANGATEVSLASELKWSAAVGSGEYQVEVARDRSFSDITWRFNTTRRDTTLQSSLLFASYYWRVRSRTVSGYGPWSAVSEYTTLLGVPSIVYPRVVTDTVAARQSEAFRWTSATGAARYRVEIKRHESGQTILDTVVTGLECVLAKPLDYDSPYTWTVQAVNDTIVGRRSTSEFFVTALEAPTQENPELDLSDVPYEDAQFTWSPVADAIRYVVTIRRPSDLVIVRRDSSQSNELVISDLPIGTRLTWSVSAVGRYGRGEESPSWPFITTSPTQLTPALTLTPKSTDGVDTNNVVFNWSTVPGAQAYDLQITSRTNFLNPDIEVFGVNGTLWTGNLSMPGTAYRWRVIGHATGVSGRWSDTASFITKARVGQALIPLIPGPDAYSVPLSGVFLYSTSGAYQQYRVLVDSDIEFVEPDFTFVSALGTCSYQGLAPQQRYYWKVVGVKEDGTLDEGSISSFRTVSTTSVIDGESDTKPALWFFQGTLYLSDSVARDTKRLQIFDTIGRSMLQQTTDGQITTLNIPGSSSGVLLVLLEGWNGARQVFQVLVR